MKSPDELLSPKLPFGKRIRIMGLVLVTLLICFAFAPWISFTVGSGQLTAIDPNERVQSITASVKGFIGQWHVKEGDSVREGQLIVDLIDNDPEYLDRLKKQSDAAQSALASAELMTQTARIDYDRQKKLFEQGLSSRKDYELAKIKFSKMELDRSKSLADFTKAQTLLSKQSSQRIVAPRNGIITRILPGEKGQLIKPGSPIAIFTPEVTRPAVEVWIDGNDVAFLKKNQTAQIQFEGWPSVQIPGWPEVAINTFKAKVYLIDQASSLKGKFRVLLVPDSHWPSTQFLRLGMHAKSYIRINDSFVLREVWRILNGFPPLLEPINDELNKILDPNIMNIDKPKDGKI